MWKARDGIHATTVPCNCTTLLYQPLLPINPYILNQCLTYVVGSFAFFIFIFVVLGALCLPYFFFPYVVCMLSAPHLAFFFSEHLPFLLSLFSISLDTLRISATSTMSCCCIFTDRVINPITNKCAPSKSKWIFKRKLSTW